MNKADRLLENGVEFLEDISRLAGEFGVRASAIQVRRQHVSQKGLRTRYLEFVFASNTQNLLNLWRRIGFIYQQQKTGWASIAVQYLSLKRRAVTMRRAAALRIRELRRVGRTYTEIHQSVGSRFVNPRYVQAVAQRPGRIPDPRIPASFPHYDEFAQLVTIGLEGSGVVWDVVESVVPLEDSHTVYDFTVGHVDHNFIANGFVVSNCGVRLVKTALTVDDVQAKLRQLVQTLFDTIPCGVGMSGEITVSRDEHRQVMVNGSRWIVEHKGYGVPEDVEHTESRGAIDGADPNRISNRAYQRGHDQLGTLGSGNHFLEVQLVETVFDEASANVFGIRQGQVVVMFHSGSRGFGYQVCDDYLEVIERAMQKYGIHVPDRQLACVPITSEEGQGYLGAMRCAANYAWANRQCLMYLARNAFEKVFGKRWQDLGMHLIYDVAHNIAKFERHKVNGETKLVCVHRKGATRAFPRGHPEIPKDYQTVGQPVIIPGDMGRNSYLLVGMPGAMEETFGTVCHGAGRAMSRTAAVKDAAGRSIEKELEHQGIIVMGRGRKGIAEEQPKAYKDVNDVVHVVHNAGIAKRVARMRPLGVIKG